VATEHEALSEVLRSPSDPQLKLALSRLALEVNSRAQAGGPSTTEFMATVAKTLRQVPQQAHPDLQINCLMDAAQYFYVAGKSFDAMEPATDAVTLASIADNKALLRRALSLLGVMYADTGNISRAIECYSQALELAQALRDNPAECNVWQNLGVALLYSAQYRDAITTFEHVIRLAGSDAGLQGLRAGALSNIALCCLHLEDFERGLRAAEACLSESKEPHTAAEMVARVLRENNYSRLLLEVNSVDKAGERCQIARRYATQSKSVRAEIAASLSEGLY